MKKNKLIITKILMSIFVTVVAVSGLLSQSMMSLNANEMHASVVMPAGGVTYYAQWDAVPYYTVTFESNGGMPIEPATVKKGEIIGEIDLDRDGYEFLGWFSDVELTMPFGLGDMSIISDITVYAKWEAIPVNKYTVNFESNGGTAVAPLTDVEEGSTIAAPTAPTKDGFTFEGWFVDEALTVAWDFDADTVDSDMTLYAKWAKKGTTNPEGPKDPVDKSEGHSTLPKTGLSQASQIYGTSFLLLGGIVTLVALKKRK